MLVRRRLLPGAPTVGLRGTPRGFPAAVLLLAQARCYATPMGPPPKGFRQKAPTRWDEEKEGTFDKVGKYFLLTEMARGMYLLMEQFFRPP